MGYNASMVRTRIAPSPTGYPHIGTIYQGLFDYVFAKKNKGKFIIRIEDTDRERFVADAEEKIYAAFDWFHLGEDESPRKGGDYGPYKQSERLDIYKKNAEDLIAKGGGYYCFCTKERLEEMRRELQEVKKPLMYDGHCRNLSKENIAEQLQKGTAYVIRLKVPKNKKIVTRDEIRGDIIFDASTIDDQVLLKSDGFPTYHLAVVVDDHLMKITHVVRGEEWITSTPKHILLYQYFVWDMPLFFHTALLRNPDKTKLSKRHSHTNVAWYQMEGFLPEAILNFLALLGWSNPESKEVFTLEEFEKDFDLKDLKAVGPIFDLTKLEWLNGVWIRRLSISDLKKRLLIYYKDDKIITSLLESEQGEALLPLAQTRIKILKDFKEFVVPDVNYLYSEGEKKLAADLLKAIEELSVWNSEHILEMAKKFKDAHETSMKTLYILLTGRKQGLPLSQMMEIYGKAYYIEFLKRIIV